LPSALLLTGATSGLGLAQQSDTGAIKVAFDFQ
jgi:hypothetical protein